jgi:hypothetical protein
MLVTVVDYPTTFSFECLEKLPGPRCISGLNRRTDIVRQHLAAIHYDAPHMPEDFVVEKVQTQKNGSLEFWHLGS